MASANAITATQINDIAATQMGAIQIMSMRSRGR